MRSIQQLGLESMKSVSNRRYHIFFEILESMYDEACPMIKKVDITKRQRRGFSLEKLRVLK
jgi:hypothetical protein